MRHALASLAFALVLAPLEPAFACGGFFCSTAPVDQSKEIVVYAHEPDGTITMAVQVRYEGQDEQFAWILPVPVPPDSIGVGTDALFTGLDGATTPTFTISQVTEGTCKPDPACSYPHYGGCSLGCAAYDGASYEGFDAATYDPGGLTVYSEGVVGPYDTVVLGASTAAEVIDWLNTNGYDVPAESEPLLSPYAAQGHVFIALRLTANRVSDVLRPIVMHMPTSEACLPIRLTAIASTPTLPIETFFLGDMQVRPGNYSRAEVELSPDLFLSRTTWDAAVAARVAELDGHAFATDFAGPTPGVTVTLPDVTDLAGQSDAAAFLSALLNRGYQGTPLLLDLFETYIDPPSGSAPRDYYNCLAFGTTASCGRPRSFDPAGLAHAIDRDITQPRLDAQELIDAHPYLTRLSTTMRVEDMTIDPIFARDAGLPDVPRERTATLVTECSADVYASGAPQRMEIGDAVYRVREAMDITPEQVCASRGGTLASSSGCSATHAGLPLSGMVFIAGLLGAVVLRAHRRSRLRR